MEEQNLGSPSPTQTINPKSRERSRGTGGLRHPHANNPFYELRSSFALSGVLALQDISSESVMSCHPVCCPLVGTGVFPHSPRAAVLSSVLHRLHFLDTRSGKTASVAVGLETNL